MKPADKSLLIFWVLCTTVSLILSIIKIVQAKSRDEIRDGWLWLLVSFTPGVILIGMLVVMVGFFLVISESPTYLIYKIKKLHK